MNNYSNHITLDDTKYNQLNKNFNQLDNNIYNQLDNDIYNQLDSSNLNKYNNHNFQPKNSMNMLNNNIYKKNDSNNIILSNLTNDNLKNIASSIDLDGTVLDDNEESKIYSQKIKNNDNTSLIKSLTKEIINNLKENNLSIYDNSSIESNSKKINKYNDDKISIDSIDSKNSVKKNRKKKDVKETIENFINNETSANKSIDYVNWFFDDCFNYKDFLLLFILYFILSQEMIKDFFSKYFNSLNPDNEGKVGVQGVIIYGLILTISFIIIKKFI